MATREPQDATRGARGGTQESGAHQISALEWAVAALGLLLVLGAVAFLLLDAARVSGSPPAIAVRADTVIALPAGGYLVQFSARNTGRETASSVEIVGELRDRVVVESHRAHLDYLPGRAERRGGLYFERDPRSASLRLWAEGYEEP